MRGGEEEEMGACKAGDDNDMAGEDTRRAAAVASADGGRCGDGVRDGVD